ncbi:MAG: tRNA-specific 2-thiouridylase MnmA [Parcubacteria group bacterium]|nr:tRNA-specific 2-thiouridylase MnmA [Parcubacteria group bacterium]
MDEQLQDIRGKKVFVGLSGGVDSGVTAALLQKAGADITGVFIKGWYPPGMPCTWSEDRRDAMRVAAHLRIPFLTLDASEEYKRGVIEYLLSEYKAGRTPNPDIMCNREVKFGAFHRYAKEQGADFIATGHYARTEHDTDGNAHLLRGIDPDKDQSYFLWAIPKTALADTLFPLGGFHKPEVRKMAESFGLPNARKRDSQGICFLGNVSVEEFLANEFGTVPGSAVDEDGVEIGTHSGALLSTLGQRISLEDAPPGPWYVISKDVEKNRLTVAHSPRTKWASSISITDTNWFTEPKATAEYSAQYRYHGPRIAGTFNSARHTFASEEGIGDAVASGQSLVLYEGEECIGGGIIA